MKRFKLKGSAASLMSILKGSNSPVLTALDTYLLRIKDDKGRNHGLNSPSSIGKCPRSIYYGRKGIVGNTSVIKPRTRRVFQNGHDVHNRIQRCLKAEGILLIDEPPVFNIELEILGNADGLIVLSGRLAVLEIKSINHCEYTTLLEPKPEHLRQASTYMYCFEKIRQYILAGHDIDTLSQTYKKSLDKSLSLKEKNERYKNFEKMIEVIIKFLDKPIDSIDFIYENKNTQEIKEFIVDWDSDIINEIETTYRYLNECVANNTIPDRPDGSTKSGSCRSCIFKRECWGV